MLSGVPGLRAEVAAVVRLLSPRSRGDGPRRAPLPAWPARDGAGEGDADGPPGADAWTHVSGARSPRRARADRWLAGYFGQRFEIRGDRCGGVDPGLCCGFGSHQGATIAYVAQTGLRTTPAGFRTATRLLGLAARFRLPVLTLTDTPGAAAAPADEAAGVGTAIAELFVAMAASQVPVTSVVIGEGVSGGALALASPGDLWIATGRLPRGDRAGAGRVHTQGRCPRHPAGGNLAAAYPGRADEPGDCAGYHRPGRDHCPPASPIRRLTRGSRAPRGRLRERSVLPPGPAPSPPRIARRPARGR